MIRMAQTPDQLQDALTDASQDAAVQPQVTMAAPPPAAQMAPVNPHDTLTAPIGPPAPVASRGVPPKMSAKSSPLDEQEEHINQRLMADYKKDSDPYGSPDNHPGFFGKLLHGLNVATGGVNRREAEEEGLEGRLQNIGRLESEENLQGAQAQKQTAEAGHTNAETPEVAPNAESERGVQAATARHLNDESNNLENPQPEFEVHDTAEGPLFVNKRTGEAQHISINGQPVGPKLQTKTVQLEIGGRPHQVLIDDKGSLIKDLGETGEKPPVINVNEGRKEDIAQRQTIFKTYQPVMDSAERFNVMAKNYEDAVKNHDQQAMLSLLYNHMGMTMGLQKGARMTKDLIHEAEQSQPWLQGIKAHYDKDGYLDGVALSPRQMREMVNNAQGRYQEDVVKARNEAGYLGAKDDGPERTPNGSVINYYIGLANGDVAKAKQLAAHDGWSVN